MPRQIANEQPREALSGSESPIDHAFGILSPHSHVIDNAPMH